MSTSRWVLAVALAAYCVFLAVALLAPSSTDQSMWVLQAREVLFRLGFDPLTVTQQRAEFVANALILMPVSALGSLIWRRTTWRDWTAVAFLLAGLVELAQGLLLTDRTASYADVVANTLGGMGGAALVAVATTLLPTRERRQELD